jgi:hypothetical protein
MFLSAVIAFIGLFKVWKVGAQGVTQETLNFFITAAVIILAGELLPLLKNATSVKLFNFIELQRQIDQTAKTANDAQELAASATGAITHGVGKKGKAKGEDRVSRLDAPPGEARALPPITNPADPQEGRWGGQPVSNGRRLSAVVKPLPGDEDFFRLRIEVASTDETNNPLTGKVYFHLHDTFDEPDPVVKVRDGRAVLNLVAYGAFTVGAEADDRKTRLELNLAELDDAPRKFKEN